jgi:hypothetical protein
MNIIIKLIGHIINEGKNKYNYELRMYNINVISFDIIKTTFSSYGFEEEEFENVTITCDCKNIKNENITSVNINEEKKVYIYTCKEKIRDQLKDIFVLHGHKILIQPEINSSPTNLDSEEENDKQEEENDKQEEENDKQEEENDKQEQGDKQEQEEEKEENYNFFEINEETIKTFDDPDFIFLIKIYLNKPTMFKKFFKYISSGNILINQTKKEIDESILTKSLEFIKGLNLGLDDDMILYALNKTNNHLNLSIRYLLLKKVEENI